MKRQSFIFPTSHEKILHKNMKEITINIHTHINKGRDKAFYDKRRRENEIRRQTDSLGEGN